MPLIDKPVAYLRRRRKEATFYLLVLVIAMGYVLKVHFVDGYPVPHLPYLAVAAALALYTMSVLVKTYHHELKRRKQ
jgi:hypothetical protein